MNRRAALHLRRASVALAVTMSLVWTGTSGAAQAATRAAAIPHPSSANVVTSFFPEPVIAVSAGTYHSCALIGTGSVYCWGAAYSGLLGRDLGNSGDAYSSVPLPVTTGALEGHTAIAVSAGSIHSCAILDNGSVACWGAGAFGVLGNRPSSSETLPAPTDGSVWDSPTPVLATGGALTGHTATAISVGLIYTCAILDDGGVACWGYNSSGQLGIAPTEPAWGAYSGIPVRVTGGAVTGHAATAITTGGGHACALLDNGTVACWGYNGTGQLGNDSMIDSPTPVLVSGGAFTGHTATSVAAGVGHTCAVLDGGSVACWGSNFYGEIGSGTTELDPLALYSATPVLVSGGALSGHTAFTISAGLGSSCAGLDDGSVACWGWNAYGQLGDGTTTDSATPVSAASDALFGHPITSLTNGWEYVCALLDNAAVACWGMDYYGQLGPVLAPSPSTPVARAGVKPTAPTGTRSAIWVLLPLNVTINSKPPGRPQFARARARNSSVKLKWVAPRANGSSPVTEYIVEYSRNGTEWTATEPIRALSTTVTGLTNGVRYSFRIRAINGAGTGLASTTVRAKPYLRRSSAPRSIGVRAITDGIRITWRQPAADGGSDITGYRVQRSTNRRTWTDVTTTPLLSFTDTGLAPNRRYFYRVRALTIAGSSSASLMRSARTP